MLKFLSLLCLAFFSVLGLAQSLEDFQSDLDKINNSFSLTYTSTFHQSLELTLEDKRYIQKFNETQKFYFEILNKYFTRYNRNPDLQPYTFSAAELSELHYDILSKHLEVLGKYESLDVDQVKMLEKIKEQSLIFSENFLERANQFAEAQATSNSDSKINIKKLIEKLKFKYKYSPISPYGIRVRSRMKGRVVALTFLVSLIATNVLPPTFTLLGMEKLAFAAAVAIQPALKQLVVTALFNHKKNKQIVALIGDEAHKNFKNFRNYLYKDKPLMKAIDLIEGDKYIKYRYRNPGMIGNIISYFSGVQHLNFSKIKKFAKENPGYQEILNNAEKISQKDFDKTWYFIMELYSGKKDERFLKFVEKFDATFSSFSQYVDNINEVQAWFHQILKIDDFVSFEKTLKSTPEGIPTIVYFEMLEKKILPAFSAFKDVKYESFRIMVQNLYKKKFERMQSGNNTLDRQELNELADILVKEARSSQPCKSWLEKNTSKFKFLKGVVF